MLLPKSLQVKKTVLTGKRGFTIYGTGVWRSFKRDKFSEENLKKKHFFPRYWDNPRLRFEFSMRGQTSR
jgi:hypothetical protein